MINESSVNKLFLFFFVRKLNNVEISFYEDKDLDVVVFYLLKFVKISVMLIIIVLWFINNVKSIICICWDKIMKI